MIAIPGSAFTAVEATGLVFLQNAQTRSKLRRGFYPDDGGQSQAILAQVTLEEEGTDELMITEHPVEQGAAITDHAFKRPAEVTIRCGWSNSPSSNNNSLVALPQALIDLVTTNPLTAALSVSNYVRDIYNALLALQSSLTPFVVVTGKRQYDFMLMQSLAVTTDPTTEYALMVTARCKQVILVNTQTITVPPAEVQKAPEKTAAVEDVGTKSAQPSLLYNLTGNQ